MSHIRAFFVSVLGMFIVQAASAYFGAESLTEAKLQFQYFALGAGMALFMYWQRNGEE